MALKKETIVKQGSDVVAVNKFKANSEGGRTDQSRWSSNVNKNEAVVNDSAKGASGRQTKLCFIVVNIKSTIANVSTELINVKFVRQ